jgi:CRP/FNR family transcriptional regulator
VNQNSSPFLADPELIRALEERSTPISCADDRVLFKQGEAPAGLYILRTGEARLTMHSEEGEPVMSVETASGSLLGLPGITGNGAYSLTAVARKGAELSFVTREDFLDLMRTDSTMALKVLQVLAAEVRSARRAIAQF